MHPRPTSWISRARSSNSWPEYGFWDHEINEVVREWMGWKDLPMPEIQDEIDSRIIVDERAALMSAAISIGVTIWCRLASRSPTGPPVEAETDSS